MQVDGSVTPDKPPSALVASDVASAALALPLPRLRRYQVYCFTGAKVEKLTVLRVRSGIGSFASRSLRNYARYQVYLLSWNTRTKYCRSFCGALSANNGVVCVCVCVCVWLKNLGIALGATDVR